MKTLFVTPNIRILDIDWTNIGGWWNIKDLAAPHWRLYWHSTQGASVVFEGKKMEFSPDEFVLIPPETHFSTSCKAMGVRQFYIHFTCSGAFDSVRQGIYRFPFSADAAKLAKTNISILGRKEFSSLELSLNSILLIVLFLKQIPLDSIFVRDIDPRIKNALRIIEDRIQNPAGNAEIAEKVFMSTNAFLRLFKKHTGTSPQQYSLVKRIEKTCIMLHFSDMDIKEIADKTGFCDRYHFSRAFRKIRGISPAAFRKKHIGNV